MIDLTTREENEIYIVEVDGNLNTGASPDLDKHLSALIDDGVTNIVLNLERLDYIASTGLRVILATGKKLGGGNGKLVICNPNLMVSDVLRMSGFDQMFEVFTDEAEAIGGF